jgi:hypothetical protein
MLEVALDPYSGAPCTNAWRFILRGGLLLQPIAPPKMREADRAPEVTFFVQDRATSELVRVTGAG